MTTAGIITFAGAVGTAPLGSLLVGRRRQDGGGRRGSHDRLGPDVPQPGDPGRPAGSAATPSLTRFTTQASSGSAIRFGSTLDAATADFQGAVFDSLTGVQFDGGSWWPRPAGTPARPHPRRTRQRRAGEHRRRAVFPQHGDARQRPGGRQGHRRHPVRVGRRPHPVRRPIERGHPGRAGGDRPSPPATPCSTVRWASCRWPS